MKKTINVTDSVKTARQVDVEFPVYRQYGDGLDGGQSYDVFMRWDANGDEWSITENDGPGCEISYEIEYSRRSDGRGPDEADYICGLGKYKCSEQEFNDALARAREFLSKIDKVQT